MNNDSFLNDFLAECREHLEGIEVDLLTMEEKGVKSDDELINKVFRAAHSIKGGSGYFNLFSVQKLSHRMETVLELFRSRKMIPSPDNISILLKSFDKLRDMINNIKQVDDIDIADNITDLDNLVQGNTNKKIDHDPIALSSPDNTRSISALPIDVEAAYKNRQYIYLAEYDLSKDFDNDKKTPIKLLNSLSKMGVVINARINFQAVGTLEKGINKTIPFEIIYRTVLEPSIAPECLEIESDKIFLMYNPSKAHDFSEQKKAHTQDPLTSPENTDTGNKSESLKTKVKVEKSKKKSNTDKSQNSSPPISSTNIPETLRVNVNTLESLVNQTGELVLARNQFMDAISKNNWKGIKEAGQRISTVTSKMQDVVMQTRLQPISAVFNKFPRLVRDLARSLNKEIELKLEGKDIELDRSIIEGLSDPLTHMVRNSADHGLESSEIREQAGKSRIGKITMRAYHEASLVVIEVIDNGNGINVEKVTQKALSLNLISDTQLASMSDNDKAALLFLPGLSTAEKVTDVSGRGVGMDVVKANLDRLGGKVDIETTAGKSTTFRIKLPLTLAVIPCLVTETQGECYAIPQINVSELLRIPASQAKNRLEIVGDAQVVPLRGELIPVVRFADVIGIHRTFRHPETKEVLTDRRNKIADRRSKKSNQTTEQNGQNSNSSSEVSKKQVNKFNNKRSGKDRRYHAVSDINIVIIASGLLRFGLVVDELNNMEEIVVKPLGKHLKHLSEYAGATIMGDGRVSLIIDATGLAVKAGLSALSNTIQATPAEKENEPTCLPSNSYTMLIFQNKPGEYCSIPLEQVLRVEKIELKYIESKAGRRSMQYRDTALPLLMPSDVVDEMEPVQIKNEGLAIVTSVGGREVGIIGLTPVEVVETQLKTDLSTHKRKGILGSTIINNKTILLLDIYELVEYIYPEWITALKSNKDTLIESAQNNMTVLLAEDSDFFRSQVSRYIQEFGFKVIESRDGQEAWEQLEQNHDKINIVVTDIEMPCMNGLELCMKIKTDTRFEKLPVIALTSLTGEDDRIRGEKAGIDDYLIKLDRDTLVETLNSKTKQFCNV